MTGERRGMLGRMQYLIGAGQTCRLKNFTCDGDISDPLHQDYCEPFKIESFCGRSVGRVTAEDAASCAEEKETPPRDAADDDWFKCGMNDTECKAPRDGGGRG